MLVIHPEPSEDERAAIVVAVERLLAAERRQEQPAWWHAGLRESLEDEEGEL